MKRLACSVRVAIVITVFAVSAITVDWFAQGRREELLGLQIKNLEMQADNIGLTLSRFSDRYQIPIGFEGCNR
jgi:hypothetical protein